MKQILQQQRTGRLSVSDVPAPALRPEGLLVAVAYSLISAGTERTSVQTARKSLIGKAFARPDQVRQVLQAARSIGLQATLQRVNSRLDALTPLGYSCAGIVLAVGDQVSGFAPGDRVACAGGGFANHAEIVSVPHTLAAPLPEGVSLAEAAYAAVGAVALQGLRQAAPTLGETVGVIGLGLLGLLTVQLLKANGCRVVGLDPNSQRCELALGLGADAALAPDDPSLPALIQRLTPGGLDAVILTAATASSEPVRQAGELSRDKGRVVVVGAVGLDVQRAPYYEKELDLLFSRSYGPGRYDPEYEEKGRDYPLGYVRWSEGRNLAAFLDLLDQKKVDVRSLTTHQFPIEEGEAAYDLIEGKVQEPYLGVLLEYGLPDGPGLPSIHKAPIHVSPAQPTAGSTGLALLGAGSFAQSMLLPHLKNLPGVRLRTVVTPTGITARSVAEKAGFELCASDPQSALDDPEVDLVLIASRHDSHAALAAQALRAGKAVFVEKPLALSHLELDDLVAGYDAAETHGAAPFLMVGFNRRFAPLTIQLKEFFRPVAEPLLMHYRINAGYLPPDHWTHDPQIGGGRILGEVCHFVDLLIHLAGSPPVEVNAQALPDAGRYRGDNLAAQIRFVNGALGTISYAANGDRGLGKERLEIFGGGQAAVLDDFRRLELAAGGRKRRHKSAPDKGHKAEMIALVEAVRSGAASPIPFEQAVLATKTTFAIVESITSGGSIKVS